MSSAVRVVCYCRVSTTSQSVGPQLRDLTEFVERRDGWALVDTYVDEGVSGTCESRPELNRLMEDARKRRFDLVLVWRFDRFARSVRHLVDALYEFRHLGVDFISFQENVDTSSALGEAIFTIIGAMAKLERDIIAERVQAGLRRARERGVRLGRPPLEIDIGRVRELRSSGMSVRGIAAEIGVSKTKVGKLVQGMAEQDRND